MHPTGTGITEGVSIKKQFASTRSPVVNERRTRLCHWKGLGLCASFHNLILLGDRKSTFSIKKLLKHLLLILKGSLPKQVEEENRNRTGKSRFSWKMAVETKVGIHKRIHLVAILLINCKCSSWVRLKRLISETVVQCYSMLPFLTSNQITDGRGFQSAKRNNNSSQLQKL